MAGEDQGDECHEPLMRHRNIKAASKLGGYSDSGLAQGEPVYGLGGVRHKGGVTLIQALAWNLGTCRPDDKGETQVEDPRE